MGSKNPFSYEIPASRERLGELYDSLSPIERLPPGISRDEFIVAMEAADASYAVVIDGRLAGVAVVCDRGSVREMAFTKTAYLTERRRITFARNIPHLLANLQWAESRRPPHGFSLFMHRPDDDASADWFIRCGCSEYRPDWLKIPDEKEVF